MANNFKDNWKKENNFLDNEDYIYKLLNKFNINKHNVSMNSYGEYDLLIEHNLRKYKVSLDYDKCVANIYRGKMVYVSQKTSKEYMPLIKSFNNHLVWYDVVKFISRDI